MKIKILIIIIFFVQINFAQKISEEAKQAIIGYIDSTSYSIRLDAIMKIYDYGIVEAVPKLEANIFKQEQDIAILFLRYIVAVHPEKTIELAHRFIDSVGYLRKGIETTNEYKTKATYYLFNKGDYSTTPIVFETIEEKKPDISSGAFVLLQDVIDNVPEYELNAKEELRRIMLNFNDNYYAPMALITLTDKYGDELIPELVNIIHSNSTGQMKFIAYDELEERNYPEMEAITKYLFLNEKDYKTEWINNLITKYTTPANYKFLQENYQSILSPEWLPAYQEYFQQTKLSNPLYPPSFNNLFEQFDYFKNLCDSLVEYSWLGDLTFSNELKNILTTAKTNLQSGDSLACRVQVKAFQDLVDNVYKDSLNSDPRFVTIEGWKFLYWNAQYILDRLPEPPANPNLVVSLKNSLGTQIPASNVMFYEGSWKDAVNNGDGTFAVTTIKPTVSIRMFYEYASQQVDNVPAQNNTYTFTTVNAAVQLKNSLGNLIDQGTVQYYAGAWRSFGTTSNGVATKELLPINYSFRMAYEYASIDKQQNLSTDPTVIFQTVNTAVQLKNSLGSLVDQGTVQYYAGAWRSFGTTSNGVAYKELLPINYSFRMTYEYASMDKQQNLSVDPTVVFRTVNAAVQLKNSLGNLINAGTVQYYAGAWRDFGTTSNGVANKELLPINYSFRMTYEYVSKDKQQNLSTNPVVDFNTVLCSVKVSKTSNNQPINNAVVKYYSGAWRNLGTTNSDGIATKELLPKNISFRATLGNVSVDKQQDISVNSLVELLLNIP